MVIDKIQADTSNKHQNRAKEAKQRKATRNVKSTTSCLCQYNKIAQHNTLRSFASASEGTTRCNFALLLLPQPLRAASHIRS
jgi:hypothetical protein